MKKALVVLLVVVVVVTGLPIPMAGMGAMTCAHCPDGVLAAAAACVAVLPAVTTVAAAAVLALLLLAIARHGRGRRPVAPLRRPPRLA